MPGPTAADDDVEPVAGGPDERRGDVHGLHVPVEAGAGRDGDLEEPALLQHPERVGERHRQRPAGQLDVGDARTLSDACDRGRDL